jgi:hypothetical protein
MIAWIDEPTHVLVEFDSLHLDSCCPHESWWYLSDRFVGRRMFRVEGPLEFVPKLEAEYDNREATPAMVEAWKRFCAHHALLAENRRPVLELTAGPS